MRSCSVLSAVAAVLIAVHGLPAQSCNTSVIVTVLDRSSNQPIDGLTESDFHAKLRGHEIPIASVKSAPQQRRLLFVLDRSASMSPKPQERPVGSYDPNHLTLEILQDALSAIPAADPVAFLGFSGESSTQSSFTDPGTPAEKARKILEWMPAGKGDKRRTPLWDNIDGARRMLGPGPPGDVIIVVSDGGDNESKLREEGVRDELIRAGVPVVAMVLADPYAVSPEERAETVYLLDLAKTTGGSGLVVGRPSPPDTDLVLGLRPAELIRQLSHQYTVDLALPVPEKLEKWQLEVTVANHSRSARVFYPRRISCGN